MLLQLLPFFWMTAMYLVTAVTANVPVPLRPELLEVRNIVIHAVGYGILGALLALAMRRLKSGWRPVGVSVVLVSALLLGLGQEVLQSVLRQRIFWANSLFDLCVDVSGAALGLWIISRLAGARRDQSVA